MVYFCNKCNSTIIEQEFDYSKKYFFKPLYRKCQPTKEAKELGHLLKNMGWFVEFEKDDGYKRINIAIVEAKVNIEVDGSHHNLKPKQALADLKRAFYSFKKGFLTLRIPNSLVRDKTSIKETAKFIDRFLRVKH